MTGKDNMVTRSEFFQQTLRKSLKVALELTESVVGPVERLANLTDNWQNVWSGQLLEEQTKFVFYNGRPYFLVNSKGTIRAFSGLCPKDQNVVSVHPKGGFTCTLCASRFDPTNAEQEYRLEEFRTKVEGGKVFLAL